MVWVLAVSASLILFLGIRGIVMAHPMRGPFSWHTFRRAVARLSLVVIGSAAVVGVIWAIVGLQARIANVEASLSPSTPPDTCDGVDVPAGSSLSAAVTGSPAGTTFCLHGSYSMETPLLPESGDTFIGPAEITGTIETGFDLKAAGATGVTIDGLTFHGFSLRGLNCWTGTTVRNSEFYGNGRNGLGCGLDDHGGVLIENNYIHDNGTVAELGRGAGGMKFAKADGLVVRGNRIEHNIGNGLWCDVGCRSFTAADNVVSRNTRKGIFIEISLGPALIEGNTVTLNNCVPSIWGSLCDPQSAGSPGGGIAANSSVHVIIRDNVLLDNMVAGIDFRDDSRKYDAPFDITVEGNDLNGDRVLNCDLAGITCS